MYTWAERQRAAWFLSWGEDAAPGVWSVITEQNSLEKGKSGGIYQTNSIRYALTIFTGLWKRAPIKVAEYSFQALMHNLPLLLNYLCFGASFFATVKLHHRSFYSHILA